MTARLFAAVAVITAFAEEAKSLGRDTVAVPFTAIDELNAASAEMAEAAVRAEGPDGAAVTGSVVNETVDPPFGGVDTATGGATTDVVVVDADVKIDTGVSAAPLGGGFPAELTSLVDSETGALLTGSSVARDAIDKITAGVNRLRTAHGLPEVK